MCDCEGGHIAATLAVSLMMKDRDFRADFEAVKVLRDSRPSARRRRHCCRAGFFCSSDMVEHLGQDAEGPPSARRNVAAN